MKKPSKRDPNKLGNISVFFQFGQALYQETLARDQKKMTESLLGLPPEIWDQVGRFLFQKQAILARIRVRLVCKAWSEVFQVRVLPTLTELLDEAESEIRTEETRAWPANLWKDKPEIHDPIRARAWKALIQESNPNLTQGLMSCLDTNQLFHPSDSFYVVGRRMSGKSTAVKTMISRMLDVPPGTFSGMPAFSKHQTLGDIDDLKPNRYLIRATHGNRAPSPQGQVYLLMAPVEFVSLMNPFKRLLGSTRAERVRGELTQASKLTGYHWLLVPLDQDFELWLDLTKEPG